MLICDSIHEEESFHPKRCLAVFQQDKINQIQYATDARWTITFLLKLPQNSASAILRNVVQMIHNF